MLRGTEKKEALESLSRARTRYESQATDTQTAITDLFLLRQKCSKDLIARGEHFINRLANTPKEFDKSWSELKAEIAEFDDVVEKLEEEYRASHVGKGTAAAGVAVGAGVAAFAPTAALAIATTFGTASTGTAIATLSGTAATNAALAWLGGGALAAGGGGMSAGSALLALAGPVGWGIGAVGIAGGTLLARRKNGKIIDQAQTEEREVRSQTSKLRIVERSAEELKTLTSEHYQGTEGIVDVLEKTAPRDFSQFNANQREQLGALINHINALSKLINKKIQ
ncbi:hypothetical protein Entas_0841 [Enterobacter soli]|uniref:hypothetical protein n=1 Tax=Enterobacter soli TaxID=885040 RepID=UPI000223CB5E|nr:hypothetical protein [Enterobacter soli]AEN63589.1 hypothetical protein Entas_0841 [Enterobacter soli]